MSRDVRSFRRLTGWTWALLILIGLSALLAGLAAIVALSQIQFLQQLQEGRQAYAGKLAQARNVLLLISMCTMLVASVTGWVYIAWLYLRYRNLAALRGSPRFSPSQAALLTFVPILNVFMALPILLDLWRSSDPARAPGRLLNEPTSARSVVLWFLCSIFNLAAAGVVIVVTNYVAVPSRPSSLIMVNYALLCLQPLNIVCAILFGLVITKIADNQNARHAVIQRASQSFAPSL